MEDDRGISELISKIQSVPCADTGAGPFVWNKFRERVYEVAKVFPERMGIELIPASGGTTWRIQVAPQGGPLVCKGTACDHQWIRFRSSDARNGEKAVLRRKTNCILYFDSPTPWDKTVELYAFRDGVYDKVTPDNWDRSALGSNNTNAAVEVLVYTVS